MQEDLLLRQRETESNEIPLAAGGLAYCLYRSVASPGLTRDDLDLLLKKSRERNRLYGLTGCLHHEDGLFFQWLEGPRISLFRLLDDLRDDDRHLGLTILDQGPLEQRLFQSWQMRFSDRGAASLLDWLATHDNSSEIGEDHVQEVSAFLKSISL
ncbi:BLUF domain-containing protein [Paracoccus sp. (in: a-proteobacteria)]|uniref:BLUF domain-containing protein n=1 Tax=Paracoccus sp. TaxID=267 RepID=UPI00396CC82D